MNRTTQWLTNNSYRKYPIVEDVHPVYDLDGNNYALPDDFILDLQAVAYTPELAHSIRLAYITYAIDPSIPGGESLTLEFWIGTSSFPATLIIPVAAAIPYTTDIANSDYRLTAVFGPGVKTVFDTMRDVGVRPLTMPFLESVQPPEFYTMFEPTLVQMQNRHRVTSLLGDTLESIPVSGTVFWEEGYSTDITFLRNTRTIRISAVAGAGAGFPCNRLDEDLPSCSDQLLSINGLYADGLGNLHLTGGSGIRIIPEPENNRIRILTGTISNLNCGN